MTITLSEMIMAAGYNEIDSEINETEFNIDPSRYSTETSKLFKFDHDPTTEEVLEVMGKDGHEPSLEALLAHIKNNHGMQPIVCLVASKTNIAGHVGFPVSGEVQRKKCLRLHWASKPTGYRWNRHCWFIGSPKCRP